MEDMYYYWLHNVPGIGRVTFRKILDNMTPKELYEYHLESTKEFLTKTQRENIKQSKVRWNVATEWEKFKKREIELFYPQKPGYPQNLSFISDAPPVIYVKGKTEVLKRPAVAVIGARDCSNYGSLVAKELGRKLALMGIVVVSGMARGIDSICQWSCLEQGGESIAVLGSGVEICYPSENRRLYERLQKQGCLISENPPFTQPSPGLFPLRNRIISGLADFVVVVEAREKSGTLITVDMALEQGKEVYAVPGRMTDAVSQGCNKLIRQGAGILWSIEEFLEEIGPMLNVKYKEKEEEKSCISRDENLILKVLDVSMFSMEEIYQRAKQTEEKISLTKVMEIILELRMKGIVGEENGYYFCNKIAVVSKGKQ